MTEACRGCRARARIPADELARLVAEALRQTGEAQVDDAVYAARLAACAACPEALAGVTCRACGCLIPVRARLAGRSCPHPAPRWAAVKFS